jgi:thioredoxin-related protein
MYQFYERSDCNTSLEIVMTTRELLACLVALLIFAGSVNAQQPLATSNGLPVTADIIKWSSYAEGVQKAKAEHKPMLVFFYRDTCPYCQKLKSGAFTDTSLADYLNSNFVPIHVNTESRRPVVLDTLKLTESQLANESWQIRGVPAMWLLEPDGCRIKKLVGLQACGSVLTSLHEVAEHTYGDCPNLPLAKPKVAAKPDSTAKTN